MLITLKKIMKIINTVNAPIHYYQYESDGYKSILYLKTISDEKQIEYANLSEEKQKEYISNSAEIYIPLITADFLANSYINALSHDYPYTLKKVRGLANVLLDDEHTAVALYMLLHELGHWDDFLRCKKNPYVFTTPDANIAKGVNDYGNRIQVKLGGKIFLTEKDHEELEKFIQHYYDVPFEKKANDFADLHYNSSYELLKQHGLVN